MNTTARLKKLRQRQQQIEAALRDAEAELATRQQKNIVLVKSMLGGALLAMPVGERDALVSMLLPQFSDHRRRFINECLAAESSQHPPAA